MPSHAAVKPAGKGAIAVVAAALLVGAVAVWMTDRAGEKGDGLPKQFQYPIEEYKRIDPARIGYDETAVFTARMKKAAAVAIGLDGEILVAGDRCMRVFDRGGKELRTVELEAAPTCVAAAPAGHERAGDVFLAVGDHLEVYGREGKRAAVWPSLGKRALLTSIALADEDVFVADAGQSRVHRLNMKGELVGAIGDYRDKNNKAAFAVPSPFFDVAMHPDGWLRVVNPGALRIEAYSFDGNLELFWGEPGAGLEGFFGCCNPANMAILADGRFVTAEKGLIRVKVYSADGHFESVVAGPETFGAKAAIANESLSDHERSAVDVAVDDRGRVIVLDLTTAQVHVFEPKQTAAGGSATPAGSK